MVPQEPTQQLTSKGWVRSWKQLGPKFTPRLLPPPAALTEADGKIINQDFLARLKCNLKVC